MDRLEKLKKDIKELSDRTKPKPYTHSKKNYLSYSLQVAVELVSPIVAGVILGIMLDKFFAYKFVFKILCFILGVIVGFRSVYRIWKTP